MTLETVNYRHIQNGNVNCFSIEKFAFLTGFELFGSYENSLSASQPRRRPVICPAILTRRF
jgi:hypothetical protein